jgi:hypothetical protein
MDPRSVLGVGPDASEEELASAYRRLAKEHHPDRAGAEGAAIMAQINQAYDMLRASLAANATEGSVPPVARAGRARRRGYWLEDSVRKALGPELLGALHDREPVELVTRASTWASPRTVLLLTDRRLLWLLEDAIGDRVRSLRFERVGRVEPVHLTWPRRRSAVLRLRLTGGRRLSFAELEPEVARRIADRLRAVTLSA